MIIKRFHHRFFYMTDNLGRNILNQVSADSSPLVSLIIPVYNAADYIEECLQSIIAQNVHDFEVIIVDDGSSDGSIEIIDGFCKSDRRLRLIQGEHGGVSKARNIGIGLSQGKYIGFVDADDCLYPYTVEILVNTLKSTGAEVCIGMFETGTDFHNKTEVKTSPAIVMDYSTAMRNALYQRYILNSPCGLLMEKRLLKNDIRFREGTRYEDLDAFYRFYENAEKIAYLPFKLYFYRQAEKSFMHQWSDQRLDALDVTDRIVDYMTQHHPELIPAALDRRFSAHFNILLLMLKLHVNDPATIERCLKVIRENRLQELRDPDVRLKNKLGALASYGGVRFLKLLSKI